MAELKIGGSDMVKIMYGDREIGGATKLEPGTILYKSETPSDARTPDIKSIHLLSTTEDWSNVNGISITDITPDFTVEFGSVNVPSDDFKNLDTKKEYKAKNNLIITVSISIVDGEYRLNASSSSYGTSILLVKAI